MDDLITEFLAETNEGLGQLDNDLVQLELEPENMELISKIFRILHTIKGTCGFLGLPRLEKVAHKGEDVLGLFRDKKLAVTPVYVSLIFECFDRIKQIVEGIETTGQEPEADDSQLIARLEAVMNGGEAPEQPAAVLAEMPEPMQQMQDPLPADDAAVEALKVIAQEMAAAHQQLVQTLKQRDQDELFSPLKQLNEVVSDLQVENQVVLLSDLLQTMSDIAFKAGLMRLKALSEKLEQPIGLFAGKKLPFTKNSLDILSPCLTAIEDIVAALDATGAEPAGKDDELIASLDSLTAGYEANSAMELVQMIIAEPESIPIPEKQPKTQDPAEPAERSAANGESVSQQTLRVNMDVLENLMTMVSELVLTRNQLLQVARQSERSEILTPLQHLNHVVSDLQEEVMKTRMQPIGNAWAKLPRIIRDVSKELGKQIDLEMHGNETELDRQILDMIKDPLTHMVRNSADHGIENPQDRLAAGKPITGKVILRAYHQGGHINIVIADDGKGLPLDKIKKKILQNGLANEEQIAVMTPQQIQQYIFHAGFSTAEAITAVSGRGVGMDVVRSNIEKIGGSIEMQSEEGKGTSFTIKIPLTLAIVPALIIGIGTQRFAIPQLAVSELVLVGANNTHQIETIDNANVLRLRDNLLPLVSLAELLDVERTQGTDSQYVVVTTVGSTAFGLIVDHVFDLEEIVIKPLSKALRSTAFFAGNTILGDGCVIMILDPAGILKTVGIQEITDPCPTAQETTEETTGDEQLMLLFRAGNQTLKATPLDMVSRLEEIAIADIEYSDGRPVIQYLGELMPVHQFDESVNTNAHRPLIILHHDGRSAGLLADQILDVAKYRGMMEGNDANPIFSSAIINDTATDIINARLFTANGARINEGAYSHV